MWVRDTVFYGPLVSFFLGVFVMSCWQIPTRFIGLLVLSSIFYTVTCITRKAAKSCVLFGHVACVFCVGLVRVEIAQRGEHVLDRNIGAQIELSGYICSEPVARELSLLFCFQPYESRDRVLVSAERFPEFEYGDRITLVGVLEIPKNFESYEGGPEFKYVMYLAKDGIRYTIFRPQIIRDGEGGGSKLIGTLYKIKQRFMRSVENLLSEPEASLLGGILLGETSSLPKDVTENFRAAGLTHILVLSGYNVNIVAESLLKVFLFLPRLYGSVLGGGSIILFALMTGASETTIRASLMALIGLLSRNIARKYNVARALTVAAFLMVLHNPYILVFDVSFQLSFLATIGIVYVSPLFSDRLKFIPETYNVREMCATTLGTQLFVAPYLLFAMGQLSLVSLLSNILVLACIPLVMLLGFLAATLGLVWYAAAAPLAWMAQAMLWYIIQVAAYTGNFPYASIQMHISSWMLMCMYAVFGYVLNREWRKRNLLELSPN